MSTIRVVENSFQKEQWNNAANHPLQSWEWGEARKRMGTEVVRIGEFEKDKLKTTYQFTLHRFPYTSYKIGYLARSIVPGKEIIEFLHAFAKENRIAFIKTEPYEEKRKVPKYSSLLTPSSYQLFPNWTIRIDLTKKEEELLAAMKQKTRYNIRLAKKKGVEIREMTNEKGFEIFQKLYFETCRRQGYFGHSYSYHQTVFNALKNKISHILIAFYKSVPVAAYQLFLFKDTLYYPYGGSSDEYRNVMAPNLLMWESFLFGKKHWAKYFDMWGSSTPQTTDEDLYTGFTRFKEGYGGDYVEFIGSFDIIVSPILHRLFALAWRLRERYLIMKGSV